MALILFLYLQLLLHWIHVEGVSRQIDFLREKFESVLHHLSLFYPEEMDLLLYGASQVLYPAARILRQGNRLGRDRRSRKLRQ